MVATTAPRMNIVAGSQVRLRCARIASTGSAGGLGQRYGIGVRVKP